MSAPGPARAFAVFVIRYGFLRPLSEHYPRFLFVRVSSSGLQVLFEPLAPGNPTTVHELLLRKKDGGVEADFRVIDGAVLRRCRVSMRPSSPVRLRRLRGEEHVPIPQVELSDFLRVTETAWQSPPVGFNYLQVQTRTTTPSIASSNKTRRPHGFLPQGESLAPCYVATPSMSPQWHRAHPARAFCCQDPRCGRVGHLFLFFIDDRDAVGDDLLPRQTLPGDAPAMKKSKSVFPTTSSLRISLNAFAWALLRCRKRLCASLK